MENYDNNSEQSSTSIEQNHVEKFWNGIEIEKLFVGDALGQKLLHLYTYNEGV